jgi:hypothetical protein
MFQGRQPESKDELNQFIGDLINEFTSGQACEAAK